MLPRSLCNSPEHNGAQRDTDDPVVTLVALVSAVVVEARVLQKILILIESKAHVAQALLRSSSAPKLIPMQDDIHVVFGPDIAAAQLEVIVGRPRLPSSRRTAKVWRCAEIRPGKPESECATTKSAFESTLNMLSKGFVTVLIDGLNELVATHLLAGRAW